MRNIVLLSFLFGISVLSCTNSGNKDDSTANDGINNEGANKPKIQNQNLNISVFLDLSDRISTVNHPNPTMEYFQRDLGYIKSVADAFENHMLHKKIIMMNDRIQLFLDPPPSDSKINEIVSDLRTVIDKNNVTKEIIENLESKYVDKSAQLYGFAMEDNTFIGSDIWGFFKRKVKDYCVSEDHRNILIIITDGYIYHRDNIIEEENRTSYLTTRSIASNGLQDSKWNVKLIEKNYGFIIANNNLENLEVLVLGINAYKNSPYEEDVIRYYWSDWLSGMGIKRFSIKSADLPSNLNEVIQNFILNPKE